VPRTVYSTITKPDEQLRATFDAYDGAVAKLASGS
jgi:hypothetical protein